MTIWSGGFAVPVEMTGTALQSKEWRPDAGLILCHRDVFFAKLA